MTVHGAPARSHNHVPLFRPVKALVRVFVVMGAIAASVGLGPIGSPAGAAPDTRVFMVADSVALGAASAVRAALAGRDVTIVGHQGIFTSDAAELAWAHRDEIGATAIVGTGYQGYVAQEFLPRRDPFQSLAQAFRICDV